MSNRNIFMDMGADTEVELHLKSNAMSFSKLFGDGEKIKSEYLPENAGGGNVDLGPLEERVRALENAPKGEGGGISLGVYDKSVYTKVLNESELLSQLTSEQLSDYKRQKRICRAAFCWKKLSGIETGQDTAVKIVLEDGTVFLRLNDTKVQGGVSGMFDVSLASFCNLSTLQKVDFLRVGVGGIDKYFVAEVESDTEDLPFDNLIIGGFVGRFFVLDDANYTTEDRSMGNTATIASEAKAAAYGVKATADSAKETAAGAKAAADVAKETADGAKVAADGAKTTADNAKAVAERAESVAHEYSDRLTALGFNLEALERKTQDFEGRFSGLSPVLSTVKYTAEKAAEGLENLRNKFVVDRFEMTNGERRRGDELGIYLPRVFFHTVYDDVCVNVGNGVFKLLNKGLCFRFYRDGSDSGLWHERQYYTFMDREVEVKVVDYRVDDENDAWKIVGEHLNSKSPQEQIKELFGLS